MKRVSFVSWGQAGVFAMSMLLMPLAMPTSAQVQDNTAVPNVRNVEGSYDRGYAGLWGLAGLLGLAGLAGRRRTRVAEQSYTDTRTHRPVV
jgi:MYXO-CTERM domain-containing protein